MIDRSCIGFATTPTTVRIDGWRVALFCQAIGETDPVYRDPGPGSPVPPTFLKALESEHFSSAALLDMLGVPLRGVLHAEQAFEYLAPFYVGDVVDVSRTVADIYDKKEGALTFVVVDTQYRVGALSVAQSRQTILVRNSMAAA